MSAYFAQTKEFALSPLVKAQGAVRGYMRAVKNTSSAVLNPSLEALQWLHRRVLPHKAMMHIAPMMVELFQQQQTVAVIGELLLVLKEALLLLQSEEMYNLVSASFALMQSKHVNRMISHSSRATIQLLHLLQTPAVDKIRTQLDLYLAHLLQEDPVSASTRIQQLEDEELEEERELSGNSGTSTKVAVEEETIMQSNKSNSSHRRDSSSLRRAQEALALKAWVESQQTLHRNSVVDQSNASSFPTSSVPSPATTTSSSASSTSTSSSTSTRTSSFTAATRAADAAVSLRECVSLLLLVELLSLPPVRSQDSNMHPLSAFDAPTSDDDTPNADPSADSSSSSSTSPSTPSPAFFQDSHSCTCSPHLQPAYQHSYFTSDEARELRQKIRQKDAQIIMLYRAQLERGLGSEKSLFTSEQLQPQPGIPANQSASITSSSTTSDVSKARNSSLPTSVSPSSKYTKPRIARQNFAHVHQAARLKRLQEEAEANAAAAVATEATTMLEAKNENQECDDEPGDMEAAAIEAAEFHSDHHSDDFSSPAWYESQSVSGASPSDNSSSANHTDHIRSVSSVPSSSFIDSFVESPAASVSAPTISLTSPPCPRHVPVVYARFVFCVREMLDDLRIDRNGNKINKQ